MDIYRHVLLENEYHTTGENENFSNIMTNLGFCSLDGSPVQPPNSGNSMPQPPFKWKYDLTNNYYFSGGRDKNVPAHPSCRLNFKDLTQVLAGQTSIAPNSSGFAVNQDLIFIPLKNNGFIYETRMIQTEAQVSSSTSPIIKFVSSPTPKFLVGNSEIVDFAGIEYLIGIPDNTSTKGEFIYLFFRYIHSQVTPNACRFYKNNVINLNYIPNVDTTANLDYVNKNANICTLIPYPYENSFIDGLYLATTIPGDTIEGKFFSFGGRNYLGVYKNLVVELLPN